MDITVEAFANLYEVHAPAVFRYLLFLTGDRALAEDLMQETFLEAFKSIAGFRGDANFLTWLCAIARHTRARHARKLHETLPLSEWKEYPTGLVQAERVLQQICEEADQLDRLRTGYRHLSEPAQQVLMMRLDADMSFREIGSVLGKTETWARVTFHRARLEMKQRLEQ